MTDRIDLDHVALASQYAWDNLNRYRADLGGDRVHFTPGSAAINILDCDSGKIRPPVTRDFEDESTPF